MSNPNEPQFNAENPNGAENETENKMQDETPQNKGARAFLRNIYEWVETFAMALCVVMVFFTFLFRVVTVEGSSMYPTLYGNDRNMGTKGDKLVISDLFYTPKTGDIVVVRRENDTPIIKRVIASEGQTVDIDFDTWHVYVDGEELQEDYINRIPNVSMHYGDMTFPLTVEENCVFVMGDNRNNSLDSRYSEIGQINERRIVGRVLFRILPFDRIGKVESAKETIALYDEAKAAEALQPQEPQIGDNEFSAAW